VKWFKVLVDWYRSFVEMDRATFRIITSQTNLSSRSILIECEPGQTEELLQVLQYLRLLCEVHVLDFETMVQFAGGVREGDGRSWPDAIAYTNQTIEDLHGGPRGTREEFDDAGLEERALQEMNRLCQEVEEEAKKRVEGDPLDTPNPRLPFMGGRKK
jgi:hypothetical protein